MRTPHLARRAPNEIEAVMRFFRSVIETPIGPMLALASDEALCALEFSRGGRLTRLEARLRRWYPEHQLEQGENAVITRTRDWLDAYFAGRPAGRSLPARVVLDGRGTPFEVQVWEELRRIPAGTTSTYGAIAKKLGGTNLSRAVGLANGANPLAIIVPCHRVIGSNGTLTGYGGGLDKKRWLLDHERQWRGDVLF
jgi:O-6-methylguanine DNA methyltransferase